MVAVVVQVDGRAEELELTGQVLLSSLEIFHFCRFGLHTRNQPGKVFHLPFPHSRTDGHDYVRAGQGPFKPCRYKHNDEDCTRRYKDLFVFIMNDDCFMALAVAASNRNLTSHHLPKDHLVDRS